MAIKEEDAAIHIYSELDDAEKSRVGDFPPSISATHEFLESNETLNLSEAKARFTKWIDANKRVYIFVIAIETKWRLFS